MEGTGVKFKDQHWRQAVPLDQAKKLREKAYDSKRERQLSDIFRKKGYIVTPQFVIWDKYKTSNRFLRPIDFALTRKEVEGYLLLINFDGSWHFSDNNMHNGGIEKDAKRDEHIIEQGFDEQYSYWDYTVLRHSEPDSRGKKLAITQAMDDNFIQNYIPNILGTVQAHFDKAKHELARLKSLEAKLYKQQQEIEELIALRNKISASSSRVQCEPLASFEQEIAVSSPLEQLKLRMILNDPEAIVPF